MPSEIRRLLHCKSSFFYVAVLEAAHSVILVADAVAPDLHWVEPQLSPCPAVAFQVAVTAVLCPATTSALSLIHI